MKTMNEIQLKEITLAEAIKAGKIKMQGDEKLVTDFFAMIDNFDFWFNIATP
jgi:alkyl sulfatase BDS1-like metallo-beta-lactamase superfamily hydrolase